MIQDTTKPVTELPEFGTSAGTSSIVKDLLKYGTPDWVSHPNDYKNFAKESFQRDKELSDGMVLGYQMDDQELLTNEKARVVNIMAATEFLRKLQDNGVHCYVTYSGMPGTVGLWACRATMEGSTPTYVCYMQVPYMCEWSVLRLDAHNLPAGEKYRGWRTVVWSLIETGVLTEERAHEIFGRPTESLVSRRYRRSLFNFRNHYRHN
jgi:hypothetical protein